MADREYTLLALHFHSHGDISISPGIRTGGEELAVGELFGDEAQSSPEQPDEESGGRRLPLVAFAVVVVAGVAAAALKRRQSGEEESEGKRRIPPT